MKAVLGLCGWTLLRTADSFNRTFPNRFVVKQSQATNKAQRSCDIVIMFLILDTRLDSRQRKKIYDVRFYRLLSANCKANSSCTSLFEITSLHEGSMVYSGITPRSLKDCGFTANAYHLLGMTTVIWVAGSTNFSMSPPVLP